MAGAEKPSPVEQKRRKATFCKIIYNDKLSLQEYDKKNGII